MFKWNGRLGRSLLNLSLLLLLMIQSPVQHMPKSMIYLLWKAGIGSGTLPRKIKSLQGQSSKVRSGKSGDPKPTSYGYLIQRSCMEAIQFDSENINSKWYDAIKLKMEFVET